MAECSAPATRKHRYDLKSAIPWTLVHLMPFFAIWSGVTWSSVALCVGLYVLRMWGVTAGHHRYFAHRSFETSRWFQFVLAVIAQLSIQRGVLWWAAHHRAHHLYSDGERDLHSPKQDGFWHAHLGWIFSTPNETEWKRVRDFEKYPELVWLDRWFAVPAVVLGLIVLALFGWSGLFIGFFLSQVLTWHSTYFINSLCHVWGDRRFETKDTSRNNFWLALLTLGEGWHNNHHHHMRSARMGFYWWEIDVTYYVLAAMGRLGLVWNLKQPSARVLEEGRRLDAEKKRRAQPQPALATARVSLEPAAHNP